MDFSDALVRLKDGSKMTRANWPDGVYVTLQFGYPEGIPINRNTALATELPEGTVCMFDPYFMECTPERHFRPWEPKAVDCLATDWQWVSDANRAAPAPTPDDQLYAGAPMGDSKYMSADLKPVIQHRDGSLHEAGGRMNIASDGEARWQSPDQLHSNPVVIGHNFEE